jgi:hypothetical protein
MHVVEILLPLNGPDGKRFGAAEFGPLRQELVERFGGVTAFMRSPAEGLWAGGAEEGVARDEIVRLEVMAERLEPAWWAGLRRRLEARFAQEEIVIRAYEAVRL